MHIEDEKKNDDELRAYIEKLQAELDSAQHANSSKTEFFSKMSHDMRTPLNAIIGLSDRELVDGTTDEEKADKLEKIHQSAQYLLGIINDVLDMSKIETGKRVLMPEVYSLAEFTQTINTIIDDGCRRKHINFVMDTSGVCDEAKNIYIDKVCLNQIFINLLSNAVKFTDEGGTVELTARAESVKADNDTHISEHNSSNAEESMSKLVNGTSVSGQCESLVDISITVKDDGCGMSSEFIPYAFESFSQERTAKQSLVNQGTGLGLSIVRQMVELMKGSINVQSELGRGTTFTVEFTVPSAKAKTVKDTGGQTAAKDLRGAHILLCEDHPLNAEVAIALLKKRGYEVIWAQNGEEALRIFSESEDGYFQMVLMDIRMPVMDGLTAAKKLRQLDRTDAKEIPMFAMTANAYEEDIRESLDAGMNGHLSKPFIPDQLYAVIEENVAGKMNDK